MSNRTYNFGVGRAFAVDPLDATKTVELLTVQNATINYEGEVQQLHGNLALPVSTALGKINVSGTMAIAAVNQEAIARYFWGTEFEDGNTQQFVQTVVVPATPGPYTVTLTGAGDLIDVLVVVSLDTGIPLARVSGTPGAGEYSVNLSTEVVTFNAAQQGLAFEIVAKEVLTTGRSYTMRNQIMGSNKPFQLELFNEFQGNRQGLVLTNVLLTSWSDNFTNDQYGVPTMNITAFANAANVLGYRYFSSKI